MTRKGQVTLFIVIGIVLVLLVSLALILRYSRIDKPEIEPEESSPISNYVEDCLERVLVDGLYISGLQGGFIDLDKKLYYKNDDNDLRIVYHYYEGRDVTPKLKDMEDDINNFVENNLNLCLNDFKPYTDQNIEIETEEMEAETDIGVDQVSIKLHYPVTIIEGDKRSTISEYSSEADIRLGHIHSIIELIAAKEIEDPKWLDLEYLTLFDVEINVRFGGDHNVLFEITDLESSIVTEGPFIFYTMAKFKE